MKSITFLLSIALFLFSCSKDKLTEDTPASATESTNYFPLSIGSYWVYHWYRVDTLGNSVNFNVIDSVYISGDTLIGSHTYYIKEGTHFGSPRKEILRDSLGYLVDETGRVYFSSTNFTDTLFSATITEGFIFTMMKDIGKSVTVPAGTFTTFNAPLLAIYNTLVFPCSGGIDQHNRYYANNVGLILSDLRFAGDVMCNVYEQRLVSYHIN